MDHEAKSALLDLTRQSIRDSMNAYSRLASEEPVLSAQPITYRPSSAGWDTRRYSLDSVDTGRHLDADAVLVTAAATDMPNLEIAILAASPHWEDRVRAAALKESRRSAIALPDGFPCIYEPRSSPRKAGHLHPADSAWVISPDEDMLHELLPLYRELWAAYEAQWPNSPGRTFEVGRLDGLPPWGVYRPGTTAEDVIGHTMLVHTEMVSTAPEHLRAMHPRNRSKEVTK